MVRRLFSTCNNVVNPVLIVKYVTNPVLIVKYVTNHVLIPFTMFVLIRSDQFSVAWFVNPSNQDCFNQLVHILENQKLE